MTDNPARPVHLECGHTRWFKVLPNRMDETLYCPKCKEYREIAPVAAKLPNVGVIHSDEHFMSRRHKLTNRYTGECLHDGCEYSFTTYGFFQLSAAMNKHYMRTHTRFGGKIEITLEDRTTPNDPPF